MLEVVVVLGVVALACALVWRAGARDDRPTAAVTAVLAAATGIGTVALTARATPEASSSLPSRPPSGPTDPYVTSAACLGCHPGEHASFTRTFHRTMTQDAHPRVVRAPLDGRALEHAGRVASLSAEGERVVATVDGVRRDVVLVTGSHREQAFWTAGAAPGELALFPFVWMMEDARFVARAEAFLLPPDAPLPEVRWGSSCIACHAVAGEPRRDRAHDRWDTRVVELGVACEACHGPGLAHVDRHRDPFERVAQRRSKTPDETIVNPRRVDPERSAAICGACHAFTFPRDEVEWWQRGYASVHRAGDLLERSRFVLSPATLGDALAPSIEADVFGLFWPDGSVRVGGREYNGLVASPCFVRGEGERKMTCTSCHAMHAGDPDKQIAPDRIGDAACTSCHADARATSHGNHAPGSVGNACVSCHMPRTSYALLASARSHRIASPSASRTADTGEPNACNLCHLDRSLAWTAEWLVRWYGDRPGLRERESATWPADDPRARVAEGLRAALVADAAVRAILADAVARGEGGEKVRASPDVQLARRVLARDPYAAVRTAAARGAPELGGPHGHIEALLDDAVLRDLLARRDTRAVTIAE